MSPDISVEANLSPQSNAVLSLAARSQVDAGVPPTGKTPTAGQPLPEHPPLSKEVGIRPACVRKAGFLPPDPIACELDHDVAALAERLTAPLDLAARTRLTTQVATLRRGIDALIAVTIDAAQRGQYCHRLAFHAPAFNAFLHRHRPAIARVIAACALPDPKRRQPLAAALSTLAHGYLLCTHDLQNGLNPGARTAKGNLRFDDFPLSLAIVDGAQSRSVLDAVWCGSAVIVLIGIDDLVSPQVDPATAGGTSRLQSAGFESCSIVHKQAGVFLQKLFVELVHLEEKRFIAHDFISDCGTLRGTSAVAAYDSLSYLSLMYSESHDQMLLVDPQLQAWLDSAAAWRGSALPGSSGTRLQRGELEQVALALMQGGLLGPHASACGI